MSKHPAIPFADFCAEYVSTTYPAAVVPIILEGDELEEIIKQFMKKDED